MIRSPERPRTLLLLPRTALTLVLVLVSIGGPPAFAEVAVNPKPCTITSQTVATTPAQRARTTLGVCEEVDLTASGVATWTVDKGGAVNPANNSATTRFTAGHDPATSRVTARLSDGTTCSITFTIIDPTGVRMVASDPVALHRQGRPSAGFIADTITFAPNTVSFYRIKVREGEVRSTASGVFAGFNNILHPNGPFVSVSQANVLGTRDTVDSGDGAVPADGNFTGAFTWPIPWLLICDGEAESAGGQPTGRTFLTVTHQSDSDRAGTTTQSKGGESRTAKLNDRTH